MKARRIDNPIMAKGRMTPKSIDEYIALFSPEVQAILERVRSTIRSAAPEAQQIISYRIPAFILNGVRRPNNARGRLGSSAKEET